jgi:hypothetical protein
MNRQSGRYLRSRPENRFFIKPSASPLPFTQRGAEIDKFVTIYVPPKVNRIWQIMPAAQSGNLIYLFITT